MKLLYQSSLSQVLLRHPHHLEPFLFFRKFHHRARAEVQTHRKRSQDSKGDLLQLLVLYVCLQGCLTWKHKPSHIYINRTYSYLNRLNHKNLMMREAWDAASVVKLD